MSQVVIIKKDGTLEPFKVEKIKKSLKNWLTTPIKSCII